MRSSRSPRRRPARSRRRSGAGATCPDPGRPRSAPSTRRVSVIEAAQVPHRAGVETTTFSTRWRSPAHLPWSLRSGSLATKASPGVDRDVDRRRVGATRRRSAGDKEEATRHVRASAEASWLASPRDAWAWTTCWHALFGYWGLHPDAKGMKKSTEPADDHPERSAPACLRSSPRRRGTPSRSASPCTVFEDLGVFYEELHRCGADRSWTA